jgi:hypothetical protein
VIESDRFSSFSHQWFTLLGGGFDGVKEEDIGVRFGNSGWGNSADRQNDWKGSETLNSLANESITE